MLYVIFQFLTALYSVIIIGPCFFKFCKATENNILDINSSSVNPALEFPHGENSSFEVKILTLPEALLVRNCTSKCEKFNSSSISNQTSIWHKWMPPNSIKNGFNHKKKISRVYLDADNFVAIYADSKVNLSYIPWISNYTARVWSYMRERYGNFGPDPFLSLGIYFGSGCKVIRIPKRNTLHFRFDFVPGTEMSQAESSDYCRVFNSRVTSRTYPGNSTFLDFVTNYLARFVDSRAKNKSMSPTQAMWKNACFSTNPWAEIFTYDVYKNLSLSAEAKRFKNQKLHSFVNFPRNNTFWFRDWFLPIYSAFGGNQVLNEFYETLSEHFAQIRGDYRGNMNYGEFVHFWSAAAREDLTARADKAFQWNQTFQSQFDEARKKYPNITELYECKSCEKKPDDVENQLVAYTVGGGTVLIIILTIAFLTSIIFYKKKIIRLRRTIFNLTNDEVKAFFDGDPNVRPHQNQALIDATPFVKDFEVYRDQLILEKDKEIGSGEYGIVVHGFIRYDDDNEEDSEKLLPVAIKTMNSDVDVDVFKTILSEVKIMAYLGPHENIVKLLGTYTTNIQNKEIYIALELCPLGDLCQYLKKYGHTFQDLLQPDTDERDEACISDSLAFGNTLEEKISVPEEEIELKEMRHSISTLDLLNWSHGIANAMMYLTQRMVIHGDLAARNVLLTTNRVAKISDFGLSRQLRSCANYKKKSTLCIPWRWVAIEALQEMKFSIASDVWSFGITLWELFTLGGNPYAGWSWDYAFLDRLVSGDRLHCPKHANNAIYSLMKDCWNLDPSLRPQFQDIYSILGEFISGLVKEGPFKNTSKAVCNSGINENMCESVQYVSLCDETKL